MRFEALAHWATRADAACALGTVDDMMRAAGCSQRSAYSYRDGKRKAPLAALQALAQVRWPGCVVVVGVGGVWALMGEA